MPHVSVEALTGSTFDYASIWQHRNLVFVVVDDGPDGAAYAAELDRAAAELQAREAVAVVTRARIERLSVPGLLVVDRWARVIHAAHARTISELPSVPDLLAWLDYTQMRCG